MTISAPFHSANGVDYLAVALPADQNQISESIDAVALWIVDMIYGICNGTQLPTKWEREKREKK